MWMKWNEILKDPETVTFLSFTVDIHASHFARWGIIKHHGNICVARRRAHTESFEPNLKVFWLDLGRDCCWAPFVLCDLFKGFAESFVFSRGQLTFNLPGDKGRICMLWHLWWVVPGSKETLLCAHVDMLHQCLHGERFKKDQAGFHHTTPFTCRPWVPSWS